MAASDAFPDISQPGPLNVLVNFALGDAERELIEAVDPRVRVALTWRREAEETGESKGWGAPPGWARLPDEEILPLLQTADVLFTFRFPVEWLDDAARLRWVQLNSAGVDHMIRAGIFERRPDLLVTTASGIHEVPISEHVLGFMLIFARGFMEGWRNQQQQTWGRWSPQELAGKTLGILGYGPIARRVALLARAFGMRVLVTRRSAAELDEVVERFYVEAGLREMLPECDYLLLAAPLTAATRHIVGPLELRLMKKDAVLMNISRGGLIDEQALIEALGEERIRGAALDVFEQEPLPPESPLWSLPNVLITPHLSGSTPLYNRRSTELFCANLRAYLDGAPMRNVVDPARGY